MSGTALTTLQRDMSNIKLEPSTQDNIYGSQLCLPYPNVHTTAHNNENDGNRSPCHCSDSEDTESITGSTSISSTCSQKLEEQNDYIDPELLYNYEDPFWTSDTASNPDQPLIPWIEQLVSCIVCGGPNFVLNFICVCNGCNRGFHQTCHKPEITDRDVNRQNALGDTWYCRDCHLKNGLESNNTLMNCESKVNKDDTVIEWRKQQQNGDDNNKKSENMMEIEEENEDKEENGEEGSTCSSTEADFYYRLLDPKNGQRVVPSNLSPSRHRKLYTTASEIRKFFKNCPNTDKDFGQVFKPEDWTHTKENIHASKKSVKSSKVNNASGKTAKVTDDDDNHEKGTNIKGAKNNKRSLSARNSIASPLKKSAGSLKNTTMATSKGAINQLKGPTNNTPNKSKVSDRIEEEESDFDILSLVPANVIPCMSLGVLSFREGTIDPKRGQIKRGHIFPVAK
ncbi:2153_t:CDS:2 [Ambispora gerdemannii]|uniref:2153_t:CDS:1 n=1 Tax=Ambispora gerdemannii TaxID=144530 RepID=A0A9N8VEU5_9GLOM|nr:2153_t:CDS:2 [Ambispora gerdemannii]